ASALISDNLYYTLAVTRCKACVQKYRDSKRSERLWHGIKSASLDKVDITLILAIPHKAGSSKQIIDGGGAVRFSWVRVMEASPCNMSRVFHWRWPKPTGAI